MKRRSFLGGMLAVAGLAVLPSLPEPERRLYHVKPGPGYASHQEAWDAVWAEQGSVEFSTDYPDIGAWPSRGGAA